MKFTQNLFFFDDDSREVPRETASTRLYNEGMLPLHELCVLERDLRNFGDIVKIIVTPQNEEDILELIEFTHAIKKPLCTGVMGARFRYARVILPLFGSFLVYCSVGSPTAAGQYSVDEFIRIMDSLK